MQLLLFIKGCERGGRWARQRQLKTCKQAEKFRMFVATPWHFVTGAQKWKFDVHFPANHAFELHYKSAGTKSTDKHNTREGISCRIYYSSTSPRHINPCTHPWYMVSHRTSGTNTEGGISFLALGWRLGCFQLSENCSLKHLIPFDSWIKEVNECNGHSKITQKYDSDWILLIPFDSSNQMIYLMIAVTCVTAKFWFGNQKESIIQLMIHSFMVNQITEWMILNWKQPSPMFACTQR